MPCSHYLRPQCFWVPCAMVSPRGQKLSYSYFPDLLYRCHRISLPIYYVLCRNSDV